MTYKFKSKASGDLIMLQTPGDQLMQLLGREPAPRGIIETADMPAAIAALQSAINSAEQPDTDQTEGRPDAVGLRQRLWPMIEMLRRCHAAAEPVVWGV